MPGAKLKLSELPDWPDRMEPTVAAAFSGVSVNKFLATCPVVPVRDPGSKRRYYLRDELEAWHRTLPRAPRKHQTGEVLGPVDGQGMTSQRVEAADTADAWLDRIDDVYPDSGDQPRPR